MDTRELQAVVNPIYTTAKGTVKMLMAGKDPDALALAPYLDLSEASKGAGQQPPQEIINCYMAAQEVRYGIYNEASHRSGKAVVVDLPCGYSPRGFHVTSEGKRYFGMDLPLVIDEMKAAAEKAMTESQRELASFAAVDATNYESLRAALGDVRGELCIVTEGLLGYFSESELISMCQAIHRLLSEFGGCWITADNGILEIYVKTFGVLLKGDQKAFLQQMKGIASSMADVKFNQNSLFLNGLDGAEEFMRGQGFDVKRESVCGYIPELRNIRGEELQQILDSYQSMEIWTMTVAADGKAEGGSEGKAGGRSEAMSSAPAPSSEEKSLPFEVKSEVKDGVFSTSIQGRMDTITAPELLRQFREAGEVNEINGIKVDVSRMAYVSSAGLRVLLMMYKSLDDKSRFEMTGVSESIREILETTGFDEFLL